MEHGTGPRERFRESATIDARKETTVKIAIVITACTHFPP